MKTYRIIGDRPKNLYSDREKFFINEEGAKIIWKAYSDQFGDSQSMERREERGGICYLSELRQWIGMGLIPKEFDYKNYLIEAPCLGEN